MAFYETRTDNYVEASSIASGDDGYVTADQVYTALSGKAADSVFGASGTNHSTGLVPDPGATQGTTKYLREDGTWAVPAGGSGGGGDVNVIESISVNNVNISPDANKNVNITISTASSIFSTIMILP